ncbi:MAG: HEAT repeat domain-containing protein, partial [Pyrinomonadaceae bacterium]
MRIRNTIAASLLLLATFTVANAQKASVRNSSTIPQQTLFQIIRAEDERRWDDNLKSLLSNEDPRVRKRAALAAGRIGDPNAVPVLTDMVLMDRDADVRQMVAFALGEIEAPGGAFALVSVLQEPTRPGRARAIEALGKIIAAMAAATPNQNSAKEPADERRDILTAEMLKALRFEDSRGSQADRQTILLGLTAVLRARPEGVIGKFLVKFLDYSDPEIIATALNTMARLRLKEGNERVRQLLNHNDPIVRANAARLIGAAEHKEAFDEVFARALNDNDLRVRVAAIRTLASLKDARAVEPLVKRGNSLINS